MNTKTACFTGPRPKNILGYAYGYNPKSYEPFIIQLKDYLRHLYDTQNVTTFITGGAQGFDQIAFQAVELLKAERTGIKNVVYVPFKGQERQWKETGMFSQAEYHAMIEKADTVRYIRMIKNNCCSTKAQPRKIRRKKLWAISLRTLREILTTVCQSNLQLL